MTLRELHLFAGIGGGILGGLMLGHRCVGAVEIDPYCRRVLEARQRDGILEQFPIHDDIRTFDGTTWRGRVDIVCGGFPCQDVSDAGKQQGIDGARSGLWFDMVRVVRELRPRFVFVENVAGLLVRGFDRVLGELASLGFDAEWCVRSAADCGAPHQRKRVWILAAHPDRQQHEGGPHAERRAQAPQLPADAEGIGLQGRKDGVGVHTETGRNWSRESMRGSGRVDAVANANGEGLAQREGERRDDGEELAAVVGNRWRATEPDVGGTLDGLSTWMVGPRWAAGWESGVDRVASGVPHRVARLRALGNAQVPIVAATAFRELMARFGAEVRA